MNFVETNIDIILTNEIFSKYFSGSYSFLQKIILKGINSVLPTKLNKTILNPKRVFPCKNKNIILEM